MYYIVPKTSSVSNILKEVLETTNKMYSEIQEFSIEHGISGFSIDENHYNKPSNWFHSNKNLSDNGFIDMGDNFWKIDMKSDFRETLDMFNSIPYTDREILEKVISGKDIQNIKGIFESKTNFCFKYIGKSKPTKPYKKISEEQFLEGGFK